jgi:RimJ/RimL family protein N-acetyltransferase
MSDTIFETTRLRCRRWRKADLDAVFEVYSDPVGARFIGDGTPITRDECMTWLAVTERNYATRGYGMFALEDRATDRIVGFCGLVHPGGQAEPEIKYAFHRSTWGQGLASEAVPALLAYGAQTFAMARIVATVAPDNLASQRVLRKAGATLAQVRSNADGTRTFVFDWRASSGTPSC